MIPAPRSSVRRLPRTALAALAALALALAAATLAPLSAAASATASISGVVTAADTGAPLPDLGISLTLPGGTQVSYATTDDAGAYTLTGLQAASYLVQFSADYNTGHLGSSTPATVHDGQALTGVDAALALGGTITGTVSLSTGPVTDPAGVALVRQGAMVNGPGDLFPIGTAADGTFSFTGVTPGNYTIYFFGPDSANLAPQYYGGADTLADASYFAVTAGHTVTGRDAVLQPGSSISGTVTNPDGSPQAFASVSALSPSGGTITSTSTASDGHYTLSGLAAGSMTLQFYPSFSGNLLPQWWSGASSQTDAHYFDVPAATQLTGYDASLVTGSSISGTITDSAGTPIPFATPYAVRAGNVYGTSGFADASGHYTIGGLISGDYTVSFDASQYGYATAWYAGATTPSAATPVHVGDQQQVTGIDAALGSGATISGTVLGLASSGVSFPAANAEVTLVREDGSQAGEAMADQLGAYSISGLSAGSYRLHVDPQGDTTDFQSQWYLNRSTAASATPITVATGQTLDGIHVTLAAAVTLPPITAGTPTITGTAKVGRTLTAKTGSWTPKHVTFTYQWLRSGTPIPGATKSSYKLAQADAGSTLTVSVTGTKAGYASATATSAPTVLGDGREADGVRPTISGTPHVGSTLTAVTGTWSPAPVTLAIQWFRDGKKISGATAAGYVLVAADRGTKLTVTVTGSKPGFTSETETSSSVKVADEIAPHALPETG